MEAPETTADFIPGSSFSKDDPVQEALSIHLVLRCLFSQFGKQKDLNSLLAVRAVCTLWWIQALDIMHDFSELLPMIISPFPSEFGGFGKDFNAFDHRIKPSDASPIGGLPINLTVSEWTPQIVRFLKDRGMEIASLHIRIPEFGGFSLQQESFHLENLRFASLDYSDGQDVGANSYHSKRFQDALILFLDLIKSAAHLEKCEVSLDGVRSVAASYEEQLAHLPRNLTYLETHLDCMENMVRFQTWPSLYSLRLSLLAGNGIVSSQCITTDVGSRLTSLNLETKGPLNILNTLPRLRLPVLPKLTELGLEDVGIHEDLPLPELMPQLKNVKILKSIGNPHDVLSSLVTRDFCHLNVTDFELLETDPFQNVDHVTRMIALTRTFSNLVRLSISGVDFNIVATAPIIFSSLKRLRILTLDEWRPARRDYDVIQLITGVSREEIPEDETTWPDSLVGSTNAITKLTDLREFKLGSDIERIVTLNVRNVRIVTQRESKFLFKAAFLRLIHLKFIHFGGYIRFDRLENGVQEEWEAGGRVIRIGEWEDENVNGALEVESDDEAEVESDDEDVEESGNEGEDEGSNEEQEDENGGRDEDQ